MEPPQPPPAWSPPQDSPSDQLQVLMSFYRSIRTPKSEADCQAILEQHKDGATALSARRFGELCKELDREFPVHNATHMGGGGIRMWRCDICSAVGSGWMQPKDKQPHIAGKRHQTTMAARRNNGSNRTQPPVPPALKHPPPAWSPPQDSPSLESDQLQVLMSFCRSIRTPKSEADCQAILEQHKDGATALSALRFGELCKELDREFPVHNATHMGGGGIRMWRCGICSAVGSGWMQPKDKQPHIAGKRHQLLRQSQMLSTTTACAKDFLMAQRFSGIICSYSQKKQCGFIASGRLGADIFFHKTDVSSGQRELDRPIGKRVTFTTHKSHRAFNLYIESRRKRSRSRSRSTKSDTGAQQKTYVCKYRCGFRGSYAACLQH
eukprot:COSAG01_NODE_10674_length_2107_cov_16.123008_1_plen_379_part_01